MWILPDKNGIKALKHEKRGTFFMVCKRFVRESVHPKLRGTKYYTQFGTMLPLNIFLENTLRIMTTSIAYIGLSLSR